MTLMIEITSDFICPWCLVVDKRLNQAIKQLKTPTKSVKQQRLTFRMEHKYSLVADTASCGNLSNTYLQLRHVYLYGYPENKQLTNHIAEPVERRPLR